MTPKRLEHVVSDGWLILPLLVCFLCVSPFYEIPQNDDWAYYQVIRHWLASGSLVNLGWNDTTFVFQAWWGLMFAKLFGLGYSALRISTLVLMMAGVFALRSTLVCLGVRHSVSSIVALLLLFNPLSLVLGYSFNTDAPYLALIVIAQFFLFRGILGQRPVYYALGGIAFACAFMTRQIALAAMLPALVYLVFTERSPKQRWLSIVLLVLPSATSFVFYLHWMQHQTIPGWPFHVNNAVQLLPYGPLGTQHLPLLLDFATRALCMLLDLMLLVVPVCATLLFHPTLWRQHRGWLFLLVFALLAKYCMTLMDFGYGYWPYFKSYLLPPGVFIAKGPSLLEFHTVLWTVFAAAFALSLFIIGFISLPRLYTRPVYSLAFLSFVMGVCQLLPTLVLRAVFDRYMLVLLPSFLIISGLMLQQMSLRSTRYIAISFALFFAISIEFLRGYVAYAGVRWHLATALTQRGVPASAIYMFFEWEGAHLYEEMLSKHITPASEVLLPGTYPWYFLQQNACVMGTRGPFIVSGTYRAPLWGGNVELGFVANQDCLSLLSPTHR